MTTLCRNRCAPCRRSHDAARSNAGLGDHRHRAARCKADVESRCGEIVRSDATNFGDHRAGRQPTAPTAAGSASALAAGPRGDERLADQPVDVIQGKGGETSLARVPSFASVVRMASSRRPRGVARSATVEDYLNLRRRDQSAARDSSVLMEGTIRPAVCRCSPANAGIGEIEQAAAPNTSTCRSAL